MLNNWPLGSLLFVCLVGFFSTCPLWERCLYCVSSVSGQGRGALQVESSREPGDRSVMAVLWEWALEGLQYAVPIVICLGCCFPSLSGSWDPGNSTRASWGATAPSVLREVTFTRPPHCLAHVQSSFLPGFAFLMLKRPLLHHFLVASIDFCIFYSIHDFFKLFLF